MNIASSIPTDENRDPGPEGATAETEYTDEAGNNERAVRLLPVAAIASSSHLSSLPQLPPYPTSDSWSSIG